MAKRRSGSASPFVAFILGFLLVAAIGFGVLAYRGDLATPSAQVSIPPN